MSTKEIIILIIATLAASISYRMGGAGNHGQWYASILDTKWRDWGCSLVAVCLCGYLYAWHWTLIPSFFLMWGALSTYWKGDVVVARWYHWLFHGAGCSLALVPYIIHFRLYDGFCINFILLSFLMMWWSEGHENPIVDELGRGALIILLLPILFI
jgi:hypothetical protein